MSGLCAPNAEQGERHMDKSKTFNLPKTGLTRRTALKGLAAGAGIAMAPGFVAKHCP